MTRARLLPARLQARDAAILLGVTPAHIYGLVRSGRLTRLPGPRITVPTREILRLHARMAAEEATGQKIGRPRTRPHTRTGTP